MGSGNIGATNVGRALGGRAGAMVMFLDGLKGLLPILAARLAIHAAFPPGTNVELATVEAQDRVRILIWERGVGPTEASGTGACASAVAAMAHGGARRDVQVVSPGGTQRVEWTDAGVFLTGWAELVLEGRRIP